MPGDRAPRRPERRRWADLGRAERFVASFLIFLQAFTFVAVGFVMWRLMGAVGLVLVGALLVVLLIYDRRTRRRLEKVWAEADGSPEPR